MPLDPFRLVRDPAVDQSNAVSLESVGLNDNPDPPQVLGAQVTAKTGRLKRSGRPGFFRLIPFLPQERSLTYGLGASIAPFGVSRGIIRRNISWPPNGIGSQGFFSWAANRVEEVPRPDPRQLDGTELYYVSDRTLGLPDSLATVVSGTEKQAPGLEPFRGGATIQAQPSTGWPTEQPAVPSYGSRIPLRRPRSLVETPTGSGS